MGIPARSCRVSLLMGAMLIASFFSPEARSQTITQYVMPTPNSLPCAVDYGPDGKMWIEGLVNHSLTRFDVASGAFEQINLPTTFTAPSANSESAAIPGLSQYPAVALLLQSFANIFGLMAGTMITLPVSLQCGINNGPDGNIWFNNLAGNFLGNINPYTNAIATYPLPDIAVAWDLTGGPDNAVWYSGNPPAKIGRLDLATHVYTQYPLPNPMSVPVGIYSASDGGMWFPEIIGNKIGRIDVATKVITEYALPTPFAFPFVLRAETPDGSLWFTEFLGNKIGRISMRTGAITEYPLPIPLSGPVSIAVGPDGNIYSDLGLINQIARLNVATGQISTQQIATIPLAFTDEIRSGSAGSIWFTELLANQIGRITPF